MEYHNLANMFPLMSGDEFEQLKADIATHGLQEPGWTYRGQLIDGRNRHRACAELGVDFITREWEGEGSLLSFIVSMNLHRRHLTSSQRAAIAIALLPQLREEARERQKRQALINQPQAQNPQLIADSEKGESRDQAAQLFNTNRQYVSDAKRIHEESPELLERVKAGELTIPQAKAELHDGHTMSVMGSSDSPEWYTPQHIIDLTVELMGTIDLDPCSNSKTEPAVPATYHFTIDDDGLMQDWVGKVYMNPPYGSEVPRWAEKLVQSYNEGMVDEAVALLPGRIDTNWFQPFYQFLICNVKGRVQFANSPYSAPFPSVIVYLGKNEERFKEMFCVLGPIMQRVA